MTAPPSPEQPSDEQPGSAQPSPEHPGPEPPSPQPPDAVQASVEQATTRQTRTLTKDTRNGMAGGVCAGLAHYFEVDPILVRAVFVAGAVLSGFSLVLYLVLWLALDDVEPIDEAVATDTA